MTRSEHKNSAFRESERSVMPTLTWLKHSDNDHSIKPTVTWLEDRSKQRCVVKRDLMQGACSQTMDILNETDITPPGT